MTCAVEDCGNQPYSTIHVGFSGKVLEVPICAACHADME